MASKFSLGSRNTFPSDMAAVSKQTRIAAQAMAEITQRSRETALALAQIVDSARSTASAHGASAAAKESGGSAVGGSDAGAQATAIGAQMRSALEPLSAMTTKITEQFNVVGGAIVTAARRLDGFLKAPGQEKLLNALEVRFPGAFAKIGITAFRSYSQVRGFFTNFGDVAGKSLDKVSRVKFTSPIASAQKLAQTIPGVTSAANAATTSVKALGGSLLVALGAVGVAYKVVTFFQEAITGGVELNETMSATSVTFGQSAQSVTSFADTMASKFGLVKNETLNIANGFGDFGQAAGMGTSEAASFSTTMTKLAADLSSFKNIPFAEAAQKIQSGLAGEAEPLRKFGVFLSADAVAARALAMGLTNSTKNMSEGAKVAARAALVQEGLARATGDLDRTQGDAANQFRKAGGGVTNFATSIGTLLMPAVKSGITVVNEFLASVIEAFEGTKPVIGEWVDWAASGIARVGVVIRNFGDYWQIAKLKTREYAANFIAAMGTLPANAAIVASYIGRNWDKLIRDGVYGSIQALQNFGSYIGELAVAVFEWLKDPTSTFQAPDWKPLFAGFVAESEKLPDLIKPAWVSLQADPAKHVEEKFAGLALANTKEAYSATLKGQNGTSGDPMKDIAKVGNQQLGVQRQILNALQKPAGQAVPAFSI